MSDAEKIEELRNELDEIDAEWVRLLGRRFEVTRKVGELKAQAKPPAEDTARELAQAKRLSKLSTEFDLPPQLVQDILRLIINEVVKLHKQLQK